MREITLHTKAASARKGALLCLQCSCLVGYKVFIHDRNHRSQKRRRKIKTGLLKHKARGNKYELHNLRWIGLYWRTSDSSFEKRVHVKPGDKIFDLDIVMLGEGGVVPDVIKKNEGVEYI